MFDGAGSWDQMQDEEVGGGPHIRLQVDHPAWQRAARLLETLGGRRLLPAAGMVYGFLTAPVRDKALQLVRSQMGWTVADSFDGDPWLPGDPAARGVTCSSVEAEVHGRLGWRA